MKLIDRHDLDSPHLAHGPRADSRTLDRISHSPSLDSRRPDRTGICQIVGSLLRHRPSVEDTLVEAGGIPVVVRGTLVGMSSLAAYIPEVGNILAPVLDLEQRQRLSRHPLRSVDHGRHVAVLRTRVAPGCSMPLPVELTVVRLHDGLRIWRLR